MPALEQLAAEKFAAQQPSPEVLGLFQPLIQAIKPLIGLASAVVGGLFGLYLIFVIARLYYERKKLRTLKDIRYDLDYLNQHFNLPYSQGKKPLKLRKVMTLEELKELEKIRERKIKEKEKEKLEKKKEKEIKKLKKKRKKGK